MKNYRDDFPILDQTIHGGKPLIYLDSAATSQKPKVVIDAISTYYQKDNANVHRGIHTLAEKATAVYESARGTIADFIGAKDPRTLIFTRNTTESINLVARTWGKANLEAGDLILLSEMEHHSNLVPWYTLAEDKQLRIEFIPFGDDWKLDQDTYRALLTEEPKLLAFTHMSNVLGTINPVKQMIAEAKKYGAVTMVDGAQSVPHLPVNVVDLDADFYAFSAHKMCGPTGIGALYGKRKLLESMPPFMGGGDMIKKVTFSGFSTNELPYKFEAGTPSIAQAIGFGVAAEYLSGIGMNTVFAHEQNLANYAFEALSDIDGLTLLGPPPNERGAVFAFTLRGIHPHDVAQILDQDGIAVRAGHHCAMPLHEKLQLPATTRASLYLYNSQKEIDLLVEGIHHVKKVFGEV